MTPLRLLVFVYALFVILPVYGQECTASFSGHVRTSTGEQLEGASVILLPLQKGSVTDEKGEFHFTGLCPGEYTVVVRYVGYTREQFELTVTADHQKTVILSADARELREVVVEDALENTAFVQNLSVLSEKELSESAGKTLGQALQQLTGVTSIQSGPGIFKPVIHGVHSQRVLILNNGIRQEGQQWGADHAPEIDPFVASNIIVIKDASSIKYGSDAIGGVVVVNPAPLPETAGIGGSAQTVFQSNGRMGAFSGLVEGGISGADGWGWRAQGTVKRSGDFHAPDYNLTNTGLSEVDLSVATGYHGERAGFEIFYSRFQSEIGILKGTSIGSLEDLENAMEREPPLYTEDFSYAIGPPRQEIKHDLLKLTAHLERANHAWKIQYGLQQNRRKEFDLRRGVLSDIPALDLELFTHAIEAEWEKVTSDDVGLCFGVTGTVQENNNVFGTQRIPFIPDFTQLAAGFFGVVTRNVGQWKIDGGLRFDHHHYDVAGYDYKNTLYTSSLNFQNLSLTAGLSRKLGAYESLALNLSSAWRPPHVAELYSLGTHQSAAAIEYGLLLNDSTNEVMDIHDVNYENEQALKLVTTYKYEKNGWTAEITGFGNYIFNYIYLRPEGVTESIRGVFPTFRYTQTDALFLGADASVERKLSPALSLEGKMSLLYASDVTNDDYLIFIPPNRYAIKLRYEKEDATNGRDFYAETGLRYITQQHRAPRVIPVEEWIDALEQGDDPLSDDPSNFDFMAAPDGYVLLEMAVGVSLGKGTVHYDVRLSAENLLNTSYRDYTNRLRYYADDIGRNVALSFKCIF